MKRPCLLITGATGRLGTALQRRFAGSCDLRLVCLNPGNEPGVVTADLSRSDSRWTRHFEGVDAVLHCAGQSSPSAAWVDVERHNVDATLNVFEAAVQGGVRRVVFMSSNWTMAGYRFRPERLTVDLPPRPTNPYGVSKAVCERIGRSFAAHRGLSIVCLRIGYCPGWAAGDPRLSKSLWARQKWLSDRDFLQLVERSVHAKDVQFAIVNGVSNNAGMRWDLAMGRRLLDYEPVDGNVSAGRVAHLREFLARFTIGSRRYQEWAGS